MKIMERGQITIPKKYRQRYGLLPATEIDFTPRTEGLLIVKKEPRDRGFREVYGLLHKKRRTDSYIEEMRGR